MTHTTAGEQPDRGVRVNVKHGKSPLFYFGLVGALLVLVVLAAIFWPRGGRDLTPQDFLARVDSVEAELDRQFNPRQFQTLAQQRLSALERSARNLAVDSDATRDRVIALLAEADDVVRNTGALGRTRVSETFDEIRTILGYPPGPEITEAAVDTLRVTTEAEWEDVRATIASILADTTISPQQRDTLIIRELRRVEIVFSDTAAASVARADTLRVLIREFVRDYPQIRGDTAVVRQRVAGLQRPTPVVAAQQRRQPRTSMQRDNLQRNPATPWGRGFTASILSVEPSRAYPRLVFNRTADARGFEYQFNPRVESLTSPPQLVVLCGWNIPELTRCDDFEGLLSSPHRFSPAGNNRWVIPAASLPRRLPDITRDTRVSVYIWSDSYQDVPIYGRWRYSQMFSGTDKFTWLLPNTQPLVATYPWAKFLPIPGSGELSHYTEPQRAAIQEYSIDVIDIGLSPCWQVNNAGQIVPDPRCGICVTALAKAEYTFAVVDLTQPLMQRPPYNGRVCPDPPDGAWFAEYISRIRSIAGF